MREKNRASEYLPTAEEFRAWLALPVTGAFMAALRGERERCKTASVASNVSGNVHQATVCAAKACAMDEALTLTQQIIRDAERQEEADAAEMEKLNKGKNNA